MRLVARPALLAHHAGRPEDRAERRRLQAAVLADQHVLQRGHVGEQADVLEGAGDAQRGDLAGLRPAMLLPVEDICPLVGL